MRAAFLAAALGLAGAAAAQGAFDMGMLTNTMAQGAIVKSEGGRAGHHGAHGVRRRKANPAALRYTPDPAARRRNLDGFIAHVAASDPASAQSLRKASAKADLITQMVPVLRKVGLRANNVADAMSAYLVTAWHGTRGDDKATPAEYRAVSAQLADTALRLPALARASNAVKQQTAESMIFNAIIVDASVTAAKKDRTQMPALKAAVAQGARKTFGFDLAKLHLGANGFY